MGDWLVEEQVDRLTGDLLELLSDTSDEWFPVTIQVPKSSDLTLSMLVVPKSPQESGTVLNHTKVLLPTIIRLSTCTDVKNACH